MVEADIKAYTQPVIDKGGDELIGQVVLLSGIGFKSEGFSGTSPCSELTDQGGADLFGYQTRHDRLQTLSPALMGGMHMSISRKWLTKFIPGSSAEQ